MDNALTIGDFVMRPKALGFIRHFGVIVGFNSVIHNTPERGEHLSTLEEFSAGENVTGLKTGADPVGVVARAQRILSNPLKFDALKRNCEHTAREVVEGSPISRQLWFWGLLALALALYFAFRRK